MGVISFYDVAKAVVDSQDFENRMLKAYIRDWPVDEPRRAAVVRPRARMSRDATAVRPRGRAVSQSARSVPCPAAPSAPVPRHQLRRSHGPADRLRRSTAARPAWRCPRPTSSPSSTGAAPAPRATSRSATKPDTVEILSGVYEGRTTGTPICLLIRNTDQRSKDYGNIARAPSAPATPTTPTWHKYGLRDPRGGGRASARLTAPMVARRRGRAASGCAQQYGTTLRRLHDADRRRSRSRSRAGARRRTTRSSPPTPATSRALEAYMDAAAQGRRLAAARASTSIARGVPVGLGEPLFDKLDADIAYAMMGINAVKGVEIGAGFASVAQRGTTHGDELTPAGLREQQRRRRAGRHLAPGRTSSCSIAIKPTSSIRTPRRSIDLAGRSRPPSRPSAATTPASASAPRRSPRRCWRWC